MRITIGVGALVKAGFDGDINSTDIIEEWINDTFFGGAEAAQFIAFYDAFQTFEFELIPN